MSKTNPFVISRSDTGNHTVIRTSTSSSSHTNGSSTTAASLSLGLQAQSLLPPSRANTVASVVTSSRTPIVDISNSTQYNVSRPSDRDSELVEGFPINIDDDEEIPNQSSSSSSQLTNSEMESARVNYLVMNYMSWRAYSRGAAFWAFFVAVQPSDKPVKQHCDGDCILCCIVCFKDEGKSLRFKSFSDLKNFQTGVLRFTKGNGSSSLKKHVETHHMGIYQGVCAKIQEAGLLSQTRSIPTSIAQTLLNSADDHESSNSKKRKVSGESIPAAASSSSTGHGYSQSNILSQLTSGSASRPYSKDDPRQLIFEEDLLLYIAKSLKPLSTVDDPWFKSMIKQSNPKLTVPSRSMLSRHMIPAMVKKCETKYMLPKLAQCQTGTASFDLWMSRGAKDIFALVWNFLDTDWKMQHVTLGMFEATNSTQGTDLAPFVEELLAKYNLQGRCIAYVKDEGGNLQTMTAALKSSVDSRAIYDCLTEPFDGDCWAHANSKACSFALKDEHVANDLKKVSVANTRKVMQATVTWTKKSGKGKIQWEQSCIKARLRPRTIPTPVKTRWASYVHMFSRLYDYKEAVKYCYTHESNEQKVKKRNPSENHWQVVQVIVETMKPVMHAILANQSRDFWTLSDTISLAMNMVRDCRRVNINMQDDDDHDEQEDEKENLSIDQELVKLSCNMRSQIISVLESFLKFAKEIKREKAHCMISLCLDHRHKRMKCLIEYLQDQNKAKQIVTEYDDRVLIPMLKNAYKQMHKHKSPSKSNTEETDQKNTQQEESMPPSDAYSYGLFNDESPTPEDKIIADACMTELKNFRLKAISEEEMEMHTLDWWKKNEHLYPVVAFVARTVHGIPASQVEVERVFSIAGLLTGLRRCNLGVSNLNALIKIIKNWPAYEERKFFKTVEEFFEAESQEEEAGEDELEAANMFAIDE
jgi:hypothetical protein